MTYTRRMAQILFAILAVGQSSFDLYCKEQVEIVDVGLEGARLKHTYLLAELALARGEILKAEHMLRKLIAQVASLEEKRPFISALLRILRRKRQFGEIVRYKNVFKNDPELQLIFIQAYFQTKHEHQALVLLDELSKKKQYQENEKIMYLAALKFSEHKRFNDAVRVINTFLAQAPQLRRYARFHYLKAMIAEHKGEMDEAITALKEVSKLSGRLNPQIIRKLIGLLIRQRRFVEAKKELKKTARDTFGYYFDLALLAWKAKNYDEALTEIDVALKKKPTFTQARLLKLEVLLSLKRYKEMLRFMEEWFAVEPYDPLPIHTLLLLSKANVSMDAIREVLERLYLKDLRNKYVLAALADIYMQKKQYHKAISFSRHVLTVSKDSLVKSRLLTQIGHIFFVMKQFDKARQSLEKAVSFSAVYPGAYNLLAYIYAIREIKLDRALELTKKALKAKPDDPVFLDTQGIVLLKMSQKEAAVEVLQKALSLSPADPIIKKHLQAAQ